LASTACSNSSEYVGELQTRHHDVLSRQQLDDVCLDGAGGDGPLRHEVDGLMLADLPLDLLDHDLPDELVAPGDSHGLVDHGHLLRIHRVVQHEIHACLLHVLGVGLGLGFPLLDPRVHLHHVGGERIDEIQVGRQRPFHDLAEADLQPDMAGVDLGGRAAGHDDGEQEHDATDDGLDDPRSNGLHDLGSGHSFLHADSRC
jgi:hypothetical protein